MKFDFDELGLIESILLSWPLSKSKNFIRCQWKTPGSDELEESHLIDILTFYRYPFTNHKIGLTWDTLNHKIDVPFNVRKRTL